MSELQLALGGAFSCHRAEASRQAAGGLLSGHGFRGRPGPEQASLTLLRSADAEPAVRGCVPSPACFPCTEARGSVYLCPLLKRSKWTATHCPTQTLSSPPYVGFSQKNRSHMEDELAAPERWLRVTRRLAQLHPDILVTVRLKKARFPRIPLPLLGPCYGRRGR